MLNYLNSNYIPLFFFIIFHSLIHQILSISGTETFTFDGSGEKVDINNICPCDINVGVCDIGCLCDKDCFNLMLSNEYFKINTQEENPLSYTNENIDSKLDYCNEYKESLDDIYNPLILAFKILKRGFCLVKTNNRKDDEGNKKNYNKIIEDENQGESKEDSNYINIYNENNNIKNVSNFDGIGIFAPIALPSGLCLFHAHEITKNIDYEVTCSYNSNIHQSIIEEFSINNAVINNTEQDHYLKKVEILYYNTGENDNNYSCKINHYFDTKSETFKDLIVEIKFFKDKYDYKKSGNYGYIKGKPIIFISQTEPENQLFLNGFVFPLQSDTNYNIDDSKTVYYDNYFENKITFEDLIIYGYNQEFQINIDKTLEDLANNNYNISYFGSGSNSERINGEFNKQNFVILGNYKDSGAVNNTQYKINKFEFSGYDRIDEFKAYLYFIIKFIKLKTKTKWWYAPGPGIVKVPKNIMYPFKIGTSNYKK